jgi:hypothetical protein
VNDEKPRSGNAKGEAFFPVISAATVPLGFVVLASGSPMAPFAFWLGGFGFGVVGLFKDAVPIACGAAACLNAGLFVMYLLSALSGISH